MKCELCGLDFNDEKQINFHHLIPKCFHTNKRILKLYSKKFLNTYGIYVCIPCHNKLHSCINEKDMAYQFNSIEKIKELECIKTWIDWKQKHPNHFNTYNNIMKKNK